MGKHTATTEPIFRDPTGRRWRRTVWSGVFVLSAVFLLTIWMLVVQVTPLQAGPRNTGLGYPVEITTLDDTLPAIGDGVFTRIAKVQKDGARTILTDPFSDTTWKVLTPQEAAQAGTHQYVQQRFGTAPPGKLLLTFDDGPDVRVTPALLDLLSRNHVPATFFTIGRNTMRQPELTERLVREGHMIGNHTLTHIDFDEHSALRNRTELIATDHINRKVTGTASRVFRLPYGDEDKNMLGLLQAQQLGYLHVGYDIDTLDWQYQPDQTIPLPALDGDGHIVLMHDGGGNHTATLSLVQRLIDAARAKGYEFATLDAITDKPFALTQKAPAATADYATWAGLWAIFVLPGALIGLLTQFSVGAMIAVSGIRITLALVYYRRQKQKRPNKWRRRYKALASIVIAAHNEEAVIAKTLRALQATRYPRYEAIVVNDGSTDATLAVLQDYAQKWPALKVIDQQPNQGKAAALNTGIAVAKGRYIVNLDADTVFTPDTVDHLMRGFDDPKVGAVAGHVKVGNRRNILTAWQSLEYVSGICVVRMAEGLLGAISVASGACAAWRKRAVVQAGGYPSDTQAEDSDLTIAVQRCGWKVVQNNDAVAFTEAPMTVKALAKQRLRWTFGNFQVWYKHRGIILRPRFGWLGMFAIPYALFTTVLSLLFMPLVVLTVALSVTEGNWESIALLAVLIATVQFIVSAIALRMAHEKLWHLLLVPIYRLIYEPLWAYLIYASALKALRGLPLRWYSPDRTNTVTA